MVTFLGIVTVALGFRLTSNRRIMDGFDEEIESILYISREVSGCSDLNLCGVQSDEGSWQCIRSRR